MRDEGELIRAAADGDVEAVNELVRRKREQVVRIAFQVTGDWDDAIDVSQGVFLRLWKGLRRYDPARRFDTWLYRITVNAAIDFVRARGRALEALPDEPLSSFTLAGEASGESRVDLSRLRAAFVRLSSRLAPKQRAAFVLREIEGLDTAEVARILEVAESTGRNHLLQARRALRAGLERDYPGLVPAGLRRAPEDDDEGRS